MNPQGTSFIPQRPTQGAVKKRGTRKIYILTYICFILFFGTILATAGTFVSKTVESTKLDEQKKLLTQERDKFDEQDLNSVRELNRKMLNARKLLDTHVSVLSIFEALEVSTLQSFALIGFEYKRIDSGAPSVVINGVTDTFNSVIFQRTVLSANKVLEGAVFKEVALTSKGDSEETRERVITFSVEAAIDPVTIKFNPKSIPATVDADRSIEQTTYTSDNAQKPDSSENVLGDQTPQGSETGASSQ